jgi:hypothetical protein
MDVSTKDFFSLLDLRLIDRDVDFDNHSFFHLYESTTIKNTGTIKYYSVSTDTFDAVLKKLPASVQPHVRNVRIALVQGGDLIPHVDHGGSVCVNFYLSSGAATTVFYSLKDSAVAIQYSGKETSNLYRFDDVVKICDFTADDHSCYLLNTGKIHSVIMNNSNTVRKILQVTFNHGVTYDEIFLDFSNLNLIKPIN